jgi:hypothetical protein
MLEFALRDAISSEEGVSGVKLNMFQHISRQLHNRRKGTSWM